MRIAIVSSMFPPIQSGSSHYAARIAEGLTKRGHDVLVISSRQKPVPEIRGYQLVQIPTMMIPSTPISHGYRLPYCFYPLSIPLVDLILKKFQPDVIHTNGHFLNTAWMAASSASRFNIPIVLTVHTKLGHTNPMLNALMRYTERSLLKHIWKNTDAFIALDRQMHKYIQNSFNVDSSRIHAIPLAIDIEKLQSLTLQNSIPIDIPTSNRYILSISHITNLKQPTTLLKAFAEIAKDTDDIDIIFVGKVHDSAPIELASQLGIQKRVHFIGEVPHEMIPILLKQSVLEAHSLDSRTGFDNASIEAMAMGIPVISCVRQDNFRRPWLSHSNNVMIVKPRNKEDTLQAIRSIIESPELHSKISKNAEQSAKKFFSIDRLITDLETLYTSLIQS